MPSITELRSETWWWAETIPSGLAALRTKLLTHYQLSGSAIGIRGDENHLRGYHRSRAWILNSRFCTNRTYSVSRTAGDRAGGDSNWCSAMDISIDKTRLLTLCKNLDAGVRSGHFEKITEWYGNKDGDTRVDGYDNISNAVATSDSSHLWHVHISFDRGHANDNHDDVFMLLTSGTIPSGGIMAVNMEDFYNLVYRYVRGLKTWTSASGTTLTIYPPVTDEDLTPIHTKLDTLLARPSDVDTQPVIDALNENTRAVRELVGLINAGNLPTVDAIREGVADEIKERMGT